MKELTQYKNTVSKIAGAMLLVALLPVLPYVYFQILRWVVTGAALLNGYAAYNKKQMPWMWTMGAIAILFNPIAPIFLSRGIWMVIDVVVAVVMFYSAKKIKDL